VLGPGEHGARRLVRHRCRPAGQPVAGRELRLLGLGQSTGCGCIRRS
jgi:hypothetical protein